MRRFFLSPDRCQAEVLTLDPTDSHHAARVLRLGVGDEIEVLDGGGRWFHCQIVTLDKREVKAVVNRIQTRPAPPRIDLAAALLKGKAMDFLIQKATELGAARITPLITDRSVARIRPDELDAKLAHWLRTAIEACKQCNNPWLPRMETPSTLKALLSTASGGQMVVASLGGDARSPREIFQPTGLPIAKVTLVIGPEGDFSPGEEEMLRRSGALAMSLGPLVLRAETAALAGLAILQHELASLGLQASPRAKQ